MSVKQTVAQVRCNSAGEWKLLVKGTDIYVSLYRDRHPELEPFPGPEMRTRLMQLGWRPEGRPVVIPGEAPIAVRMTAMALAGWRPSATERWVWTIPVYKNAD